MRKENKPLFITFFSGKRRDEGIADSTRTDYSPVAPLGIIFWVLRII
jgi:hypothetical protein